MEHVTKRREISGSHRAVIDTLARELELPVQEVERVYTDEIAKLDANARIKGFVSVLAVGRVRTALRTPQQPTH